MAQKSIIEHEGVVVERVQGELTVRIDVSSACGSCHAKKSCMLAETDHKMITVSDDGQYKHGDKVLVLMREDQGIQAIFLGYLWPFVMLLSALILGNQVFDQELVAGLFAITILVPYYLALYWFRDKIKKQFIFQIKSLIS